MAAFVLALVTSPAFLLRRGDSIFLALYCVLWLIAWYTLTHRLDRFLDPMTPALAALGGIGFASLSGRTGRRMGQGLLVGGLAYAAATTFLIYAAILQVGLALPVETFVRGVSEPTTYSHAAIEKINKELAPDATVLFVGEARTFYCRRRALAATVFDRHPIDRILDSGPLGDAARRVRDGLRELGVTHLYVNWPEIARLAGSYTYRYGGRVHRGLRDEVYARLFARMTERGYLRPIAAFGKDPQGRPVPRFILYALAGARDTRLGHTLLDRAALPSTRQSRYGDGRRSIQ
jgi:hypothetical protein